MTHLLGHIVLNDVILERKIPLVLREHLPLVLVRRQLALTSLGSRLRESESWKSSRDTNNRYWEGQIHHDTQTAGMSEGWSTRQRNRVVGGRWKSLEVIRSGGSILCKPVIHLRRLVLVMQALAI